VRQAKRGAPSGLRSSLPVVCLALLSLALAVVTASAQVTHPRALAMGEAPAIFSGGQFVAGPNPYPKLLTDREHQAVGRLSYYLFRRDLRRAEDWVARHDDALGDLGRGLLLRVRADGGEKIEAAEWQEAVDRIRARRHEALKADDTWGWMVRSYGYLFEGWRDVVTGHSLRGVWARNQARRGFLRVKRLAPDLAEADLGVALLLHHGKTELARRFLDHAAEASIYVAPLADLFRVAWSSGAGDYKAIVAISRRYHLTVVHSPFLLSHVGDAYLASGRPREAGQWYQRLTFELRGVGWPKLKVAEAHAAHARVERSEFWQRRMRTLAKTNFEDYLASRDADPARRARAYVELGRLEVVDQRSQVARRYFRMALQQQPGDPDATAALASLEAK